MGKSRETPIASLSELADDASVVGARPATDWRRSQGLDIRELGPETSALVDEIVQRLFAVGLRLHDVMGREARWREQLGAAAEDLDRVIHQVRELAFGVRANGTGPGAD